MHNVKALLEKLKEKKDFNLNMMIGLDGFVDEIIHIVDKRLDYENYTRILTIEEFGKRISNAAGLSTNIEFIPVQTKLGGNGPIFANALLEYGISLTYVGMLGKPSIHPVFQDMADRAKAVYSLCEPGHSDACEFEDGKIIIGKHASLRELTWDLFKENLGGPEGIAKIIDENQLLGMENWTMLPHMSDIWQGIITEVFPLLSDKAEKPFAFFDLADPEKRTKEDISHAMGLINQFEDKFRTILGLNEKEAYEIAEALDIKINDNETDKLKATTMAIYEELGIYCLMVHPVRSACCVINGEYYYADGPYCQKPVLTTGAGDNFNAGFCLGEVMGLDPLSSLLLGVCSSGFYVRNGHSPTYDQVIEFADKWAGGKLEN
jgi:sugar/nucleoside kinase (ribokinase family)